MTQDSTTRSVRWTRLTAEAVAVIASILIAFAIDAAWDRSQEREELRSVLVSLQGEFTELRDTLDTWTSLTERRASELAGALEALRSPSIEGAHVQLIDSTMYSVVNMADWDPRGGVIDGVIASGKLDLLADDELQSALGSWPGVVDDAVDNQHLMQDFVLNQLIPALARGDYSVSRLFAMSRDDPETWPASFTSDAEALAAYRRLAEDREVLDLIAAKYAFVNSSAGDLRRASEAASRILDLIEAALAS